MLTVVDSIIEFNNIINAKRDTKLEFDRTYPSRARGISLFCI